MGRRQNLMPGLALAALAAAGWIYVACHAGSARSTATGGPGAGTAFLSGWTAMTAMMVTATLPLILLYRTIARSQLGPARSRPARRPC